MPIEVRDSGTDKTVQSVYAQESGTDKEVQEVIVHDSGTDKTVFTAATVIDNFEDGDVTEWTIQDAGTKFEAQQTVVAKGSWALENRSSNEFAPDAIRPLPDEKANLRFFARVSKFLGDSDFITHRFKADTPNFSNVRIFDIGFQDNSGSPIIEWAIGSGPTTIMSSLLEDVWYKIEVIIDYNNDIADIYVNDSLELSDAPLNFSVTTWTELEYTHGTANSGGTRSAYLDHLVWF